VIGAEVLAPQASVASFVKQIAFNSAPTVARQRDVAGFTAVGTIVEAIGGEADLQLPFANCAVLLA